MKWFRYSLAFFGVLVVGFFIWLLAINLLPPSVLYSAEVAQVENYISQIEAYKRDHSQYPDERQQNIVPRVEYDNPFFYEGGASAYRIGFRIGFDEVYYYDSETKKWSFETK
jgi:hypothetical protein